MRCSRNIPLASFPQNSGITPSCLWMFLQLPRNDWDSVSGYSHSVQTMMLMVMKQASGRPWGDHGLFLRYHIEAATIKGINSFRQYKTDITTIGRSELVNTHFCVRPPETADLKDFFCLHEFPLGSWKECIESWITSWSAYTSPTSFTSCRPFLTLSPLVTICQRLASSQSSYCFVYPFTICFLPTLYHLKNKLLHVEWPLTVTKALDLWVQLETPPARTEDGVAAAEQVRHTQTHTHTNVHYNKQDRN